MRVVAIFLVLILFAPAVTRACECCPATPLDGTLIIQKTPCQGCCPEYQALPETQSALHEKSFFLQTQRFLTSASGFFKSEGPVQNTQKRAQLFAVFSPPPPSSFHTLPVVLRL